MRFHGGGTAWNHVAMDQAIVDSGLEPDEVSNERTGIIMGSGGPSTRAIVEAADITRAKGPKRVGPFAVPKSMSSTASATLVDLVQDQGRQLFDLVGLRDLQSLHRRGLRAYPDEQTGRDVRRRLRGARLDAVGPVRRDGRDVLGLQRDAVAGLARLRQEPRRLRHLGRRRASWCWRNMSAPRRRGAKIYGEIAGYGATSDGARHGARRPARAPRAACARRWRR